MPHISLILRYLHKQLSLGQYRHHRQKGILFRLGRLFLILLSLISINSASMVYFEAMSWGNAFWLSATSITTVGYGDLSATTPEARWVTVIVIYAVGVSLLAQLASEYIEYRINLRELKTCGLWRWKTMHDHIVVLNVPNRHSDEYLKNLFAQIRNTPELENTPIQVLTPNYSTGLPSSISNYDVVHYDGITSDDENLRAVNIDKARVVLLLAEDHADQLSDSLVFDTLHRIKSIGTNAAIIAESVSDNNREHLHSAGANSVIRPIRAYPELLVRAIVAPGTESILENLFTYDGDRMERYDLEFNNRNWGELICEFVNNNSGIPLAYIDNSGELKQNPLPETIVSGRGLILLLNNQQRCKYLPITK